MEAKDVKVGMRVILNKDARRKDGTNTMPDNSAEWGYRGGKDDGFLLVVRPHSNCYGAQWVLAARDVNHGGDYYNASDFQPATIEVGDTVRLIYVGKERVVSSIRDDKYYMLYDDGKGGMTEGPCGFFAEGIDLVRKAKRVPNSEIPKPADRRPTVGDWVEVVSCRNWGHPVGTIGCVCEARSFGIGITARGECKWSAYDEVKLTTPPEQKPREFKVGDRVTVKNQYNYSVGGRTGTIVAKHGTREWSVDFGCSFDGHDCGCMKTNTGWWVPEFLLDHATEPATVLKSDADAAVRRAFDAGYKNGQQAVKARVLEVEFVPMIRREEFAKFWEAD